MTMLLEPATAPCPVQFGAGELPPFPVRRFTVEEYEELSRLGILTEDDRVELLEGWIVPTMTHGIAHDWAATEIASSVGSLVSENWTIRVQCAFKGISSMPEPDVAVLRGRNREYATRRPSGADAGLIVEVADSSLDKDRRKARIYAAAGVREYWILNLLDRQIEVHRRPDVDKKQYMQVETFAEADSLPLELDDLKAVLQVKDLLPPPENETR